MKNDPAHTPDTKNASAYLIVLVAMTGVLSLLGLVQVEVARRQTDLRIQRADTELRAALLLGLREGMELVRADGLQPPEEERIFSADNGARIHLHFQDAQSRLELNSLLRSPAHVELFANLMRSQEIRIDRGLLDHWVLEGEEAVTLGEWREKFPEGGLWIAERDGVRPSDHVRVLPLPSSGPVPLNLNTVEAERLNALLGPELRAWSDTILRDREREPLLSADALLGLLPEQLAQALRPAVSVETAWIELTVHAEYDLTVREMTALLHRHPEGEIEVMACQW